MTDNIDLVKTRDHYKNVKISLEKKIDELKTVLARYQQELEVAESRILKAEKNLSENKDKKSE